MAKTSFIDGDPGQGIPGTRVYARFLNQTNYQIPTGEDIDGSGALSYGVDIGSANACVVNLTQGKKRATGSNTSASANKLIDSGATFQTASVQVGDVVLNVTDKTSATVLSVDSQTQLTISADIFTGTGKLYAVGPDIQQLPQALVDGFSLIMKAAANNTGAATLKVNNSSAIALVTNNFLALPPDSLVAGQLYEIVYQNGQFILPAAAASVGNGYWGGGDAGAGNLTKIDGLRFIDEGMINPVAALSVAREALAGVNSSAKGYFGGGDGPSAEIDGILFSNESAINPAATLSVARYGLAGVNSSTKGYFGGGYTTVPVADIDGIQFSNDSAINPAAALSSARHHFASVNSSLKGYFGGGYVGPSAEIDGIQFSDESAINPSAALNTARYYLAGVNSTTKGYFGGGTSTGSNYLNGIDGIQFSDESAINLAATLSVGRHTLTGVNSTAKGYFAGGMSGSSTFSAEIDGLRFADEAAVNLSARLSATTRGRGGVQSGGIL